MSFKFTPADMLRLSLRAGSVYYMEEASFASEDPHYFVVLNVDPKSGDAIVLVNATSKIAKAEQRERVYKYPAGTLVYVKEQEYTHFTVDSVFDCYTPLVRRFDDLVTLHTQGKLKFKEPMPTHIVDALRTGALGSRDLEEKFKALLVPPCPPDDPAA